MQQDSGTLESPHQAIDVGELSSDAAAEESVCSLAASGVFDGHSFSSRTLCHPLNKVCPKVDS